MKTRKNKTSCRHKHRSSCKHSFSKTVCKRMLSKHSNRNKRKHSNSMRKRTKRSSRNKKRRGANVYRGGGAQYPAVYGIDNKSVLYPISPHGITAGFFDPPIDSNGPDGYGPIGCDVVSGESMSGKGTFIGGGSQGTLAPQPLVNLTRSLTGGVTEVLNGFGGYMNSDSLNPMPYNQPGIDQNIKVVRGSYPDLGKSYEKADKYVSTTF